MKSRVENKLLRGAVVLCGAALWVGTAMAQDAPPPPMPEAGQNQQGPPPGGRGGPGRGGPEQRLEMMQKQLGLSADQTAQVKAIFEEERTKMEALRADTATSPEDKRPKMMAIRKDEETRLVALLTPDQKTKYDAMQARMRERGQGRPGGAGADGSAPPPPPPPQQ